MASGPSFSPRQAEYIRQKNLKTICINRNYEASPWADILYACDEDFWKYYPEALDFKGLKITQSAEAARKYGLHYLQVHPFPPGLSFDPEFVHGGQNSGYQALNLAVLLGAKQIILLGYDMRLGKDKAGQDTIHWFGRHRAHLEKQGNFKKWIEYFNSTVPDLEKAGVKVINCSPGSAIQCFERGILEKIL